MRTPADAGLDYEDVFLDAADGVRVHAWLVRPEGDPVGRVLFLHGNAQNVSYHLPAALWWVAAGHEVLALDYRGYGRSEGVAGLDGALRDVDAALRFLERRADDDALPTHVFGQSLGASLAVLALAARVREGGAPADVDALVIEAGFTRFGRIAGEVAARVPPLWPLQWVPRLTLAGLPDPVDAIDEVGVPVLVVHSVDDRIIEVAHGRELFAAARPPKRLVEASGPHIRAVADPAVRAAALEFVREVGATRTPAADRSDGT